MIDKIVGFFFKPLVVFHLKIFATMACCLVLGGLVGRYWLPNVPEYCEPPSVDCVLEESKAIEGCEHAAAQMEQGWRRVTQELESCEYHFDSCREETTKWFTRANSCATLLGQLKTDCSNYLKGANK